MKTKVKVEIIAKWLYARVTTFMPNSNWNSNEFWDTHTKETTKEKLRERAREILSLIEG